MAGRNHIIAFLIALLAILTCLPLVHSGYTSADDIYFALGIQEGWRSAGMAEAQMTGRLQHAFIGLLMPVAYGWGHYGVMKTLSIAAILSNVAAMFLVVRLLSSSARFALLAVVFFFAFVQNSLDHTLLTSYPFVLPFAFTLFWLSAGAWWRALQGARWMGAISTVLFLVCLLTYEIFITYALVFPAMTFAAATGTLSERARRSVRTPHVALLGVMLLVIIGFRLLLQSDTGQEMMSAQEYRFNVDIGRVSAVLAQYGAAALPLRYALLYRPLVSDFYLGFGAFRVTFGDIFAVVDAAWLVKALTVAFLTALLLKERDVVGRRGLLWLLVFTLMVLTNLPLAVTAKYQSWVIDSGTPGYLTAYFCVFGVVILIALVLDGACGWLSRRGRAAAGAVGALIVAIVFVASYATDVVNAHVALAQRLIYERGKAMDAWIASPAFAAIPEGSLILAPTLFEQYPGTTQVFDDYWSRYVLQHGRKHVEILRAREEWLRRAQAPDGTGRLYYLRLQQDRHGDALFIVFGSVPPPTAGALLASRDLTVLSHARADRFRITGRLFGADARCRARVFVDGQPSESTFTDHFEAEIDRLRRPETWLWTKLSTRSAQFATESVTVAAATQPLDDPIGVVFGEGFHLDEVAHRWADARATLTLQNREARAVSVDLGFEVKAPGLAPGTRARLEAAAGDVHRTWEIGEEFEQRSLGVQIPPLAAVDVTISTTAPPFYAPLDGRALVMMFLPGIRTLEKGCEEEQAPNH
ncbi:MAG TPA: hypothetical protein VFV95_13590 [Vicinamibacterales bacterium]|nr:hypothetical protein [Vicinamibacterales bacterium]